MKKLIVMSGIVVAALFVVIQVVPIERINPSVESDIPTSPEVKSLLKRACYDCHSNETVWPWYSRVAPISWIVTKDVREGRADLNFSTWNRYSTKEQAKKLKESWEEVKEGKMPPWSYLAMHRMARLSPQDHELLRGWAVQP